MALCQTSVLKLYHAVIEDVVASVRDEFLDEGVDEQVLQEMKQIWRTKLMASKAVEINHEPPEPQPPQIVVNNPMVSKAAPAAAKAEKAVPTAVAAAPAPHQTNIATTTTTSSGSVTNTSIGADIKPNIATWNSGISNNNNYNYSTTTNVAAMASGDGPSTSKSLNTASTSGTALLNFSIKQNQPPPWHPIQQQQQQILTQQKNILQYSASTSHQQLQKQQQSSASAISPVAALDPNKIMPVNITLPAQPSQIGTMYPESRILTIHVPASALEENQLAQILTAHLISSIMSLPTTLAASVLQQHVNAALGSANMQKNFNIAKQLDGAVDTSDEDESEESDDNMENDDDDDDDDDLDKDDDEDVENKGGADGESLNSEEDDLTDEEAGDLFDTDNVIVCQYEKVTRSRNKWKFYLKDGIMNIGGKEYVFQKLNGDAEW